MKSYNHIKFFIDAAKCQMPIIPINIDEHNYVLILVDTGSNHNLIFQYAYEEMKDRFTQVDEQVDLMGANGIQRVNNVVKGNFIICNKQHTMKFIITDSTIGNTISDNAGVMISGVIGTIFMVKNKWIIDYNKQEVLIPKE